MLQSSCASSHSCSPRRALIYQNNALSWWMETWALMLDCVSSSLTPPTSCVVLGRFLILCMHLSALICPKGVVIIHSIFYNRYVWRIHSLHTYEPLWTLHGPITDRFKNSVCYYYCLKVDFCQSDGYEMEFNVVVIGIPVLLVRLSIFSCLLEL